MKTNRLDIVLYGTALALALVGGGLAVAKGVGRGADPQPQVLRAPEPEQPQAEITPRLPAVPDLESQPPPAPAGEDPRLAGLTVEMHYLSRARELLADHPAEALAALEEHRARHPDGALREQREAYAIEALVALDRISQAERRYYDFVREHPRSSFRRRLDALLR